MTWDRSKQKYFISRQNDIVWMVITADCTRAVKELPATWDNKLIKKICFAENDDEVIKLISEIKFNG